MVVVSHQIQDILHRDHGIRYSLDETLHNNFFYNKRLITKKHVYKQTVKVWDLKEKCCYLTLSGHQGRVYSVAFSPCGTKVLSASKDKTLKLWNVTRHHKGEREISTLEGHTRRVLHCCFSSNSFLAASASADMTVRVWDTITSTCVFILTGHTGSVHQCVFSVDGAVLVSASDDKTLRVWDIRDGGGASI
mgnify:FL=1